MDLAEIRARFAPEEGIAFLDTATYGLPSLGTIAALRGAMDRWQAGTADWIEDWDKRGDVARSAFASLIGAEPSSVALLPSASVGVGLVAAALGPGDEVVVPEGEFTSVLFPLLVAAERGAVVREVPLEALADAIRPSTTWVALTLVQMNTGRMADIDAVLDAAGRAGAHVLVDATQGVPFVPLAGRLERIDVLVAAAYKHLLCPRGVAFGVLSPWAREALAPIDANWRSADRPYGRYFGGPLTLAGGAAAFDVSLAWFPWVGAAVALGELAEWSEAGALEPSLAQARALADGLGVPYGGASLVCAPMTDIDGLRATLAVHRIRASVRGTGVRVSTHVYTSDRDVERAIAALAPLVTR
jgi:selenocysteine lyase/cysteine desulfurase